MPFPFAAAAIAGGSMLGGILGNRARSGEAQKNRDFQSAQAGRQMGFQERMRNTEWQSAVADMRAAGINPALAYQQGGASSPSGAAGSGSKAEQEDVVAKGISSAMQYKRLKADVDGLNATRKKVEAETEVIKARPGQILGPGVQAATGLMENLLSPRNMRIVGYELGASARSIKVALEKVLLRYAAPKIGPNTTPRRR